MKFGDGEGVDCFGDDVPVGGVGEGEGEVAFDGLVAGEVVGGDAFEGQCVERSEVELREVDRLAEFAALGFGCGEFAEVGDGGVVEERGGATAGLSQAGAATVKVSAEGPPVRVKREVTDSIAPFSSNMGASWAEWSGVVCGCAVVRPRESCGDSLTSPM